MTAVRRALGLMSGTSMDGIDAAILLTDGVNIAGFGASVSIPYSEPERAILRKAVAAARGMADRDARPAELKAAEDIVTTRHIAAVMALLEAADMSPGDVDVIGFHGQTVFHNPDAGITVQLGNARRLADEVGIDVVHDFRAADVAAGGEGAPFVPVYHRALADFAGLDRPAVIVNIGGVANITIVAEDGAISACDTGPGNALIDDFM
ncbi:MAG: anhydro-N-acetylmuramic acid kinase, partial [Hyphomicrobiales bacterium]|nr:anhydro-N-acetylmuramic acid kinase [Hyphomicrobiales bacterium]